MYFFSIHINTYRLFSICIKYVPDAYEFVLAGLEFAWKPSVKQVMYFVLLCIVHILHVHKYKYHWTIGTKVFFTQLGQKSFSNLSRVYPNSMENSIFRRKHLHRGFLVVLTFQALQIAIALRISCPEWTGNWEWVFTLFRLESQWHFGLRNTTGWNLPFHMWSHSGLQALCHMPRHCTMYQETRKHRYQSLISLKPIWAKNLPALSWPSKQPQIASRD